MWSQGFSFMEREQKRFISYSLNNGDILVKTELEMLKNMLLYSLHFCIYLIISVVLTMPLGEASVIMHIILAFSAVILKFLNIPVERAAVHLALR